MPRSILASWLTAVLTALLVAGTAAGAGSDLGPRDSFHAFRGTGSWVSLYDRGAWASPERVVGRLRAHHVRTLYLETSNDRQAVDVVRPALVTRFLDVAHAAGIDVVGWYLPSLATPRRDVRRALAGARFRTAAGNGFDGFALDIEATTVRAIPLRSRRAVALAAVVRRRLPRDVRLGAITIDPVGARYWPRYPFRALARSVDLFMPMAYFTARTHGAARVGSYSAANIRAVRRLANDARFPVHPIGGDVATASLAETRAFFRASAANAVLGVSLWEYGAMSPLQWALLART